MDGQVNIVDALQIARAYVGLDPTPYNEAYADTNCDGTVNIVDALQVARFYVGSIDELCGSTETETPTQTVTPTPTTTPTAGTAEPRVDNPYVGGTLYVDQVWSEKARNDGGAAIADIGTFLWMDRIGAITDGIGLRGHLDAAIQQGANVFQVVIYDLPNRDCFALASNGELRISEGGMQRYQTEYIDPIVEILGDANYRSLRIVCVIEPDSLPNLVTNLDDPDCAEANGAGGYVEGIQYALDQLGTLPNTYCYVDYGHSGWLGWPDNYSQALQVIGNAIKGASKGVNSVAGLVTCTANYTPTEEPYLKNVSTEVIRQSSFYEWNTYVSELPFAQAVRQSFIQNGFPSTFGMLIDTSRNGWGGPDRPTRAVTSGSNDQIVDGSRIDRRTHRGNWCNQKGGIGERPKAAPATGIDAYVWVKPPGESDGVSTADFEPDPNDPAKQFDPNCDPNGQSSYGDGVLTGAVEAPHAGRWNTLHFQMLMDNAYPPL
ncbi:MAG: glycoside hydrolase family 6 protein [Spirochaetales bacterium]|nr:glycoside hydrolase family 6 protein [Spirochaetales bacterium]